MLKLEENDNYDAFIIDFSTYLVSIGVYIFDIPMNVPLSAGFTSKLHSYALKNNCICEFTMTDDEYMDKTINQCSKIGVMDR
jgi:hypothetical protein